MEDKKGYESIIRTAIVRAFQFLQLWINMFNQPIKHVSYMCLGKSLFDLADPWAFYIINALKAKEL